LKIFRSRKNFKKVRPRITPKNCLNKEIRASKSFAVPETKFFEVISSRAVVMASPGTKIIMADTMVRPIFKSV
jgi:hypothetical protein